MVRLGYADGLVCGTFGRHETHREYVQNVIGTSAAVDHFYAMNLLMLPGRTVFIGDTYINYDPTADELADMTLMAAEKNSQFRHHAKSGAAFALHLWDRQYTDRSKNAGDAGGPQRPRARAGSGRRDAWGCGVGRRNSPGGLSQFRLKGQANLLVMPTLDAAAISFQPFEGGCWR